LVDWRFYSGVVFVCVAVGSFLYKRAQMMGIRPGSFMVVQSFCFFSTVLLAGLLREGSILGRPYPALGLLAGVLGMTGAFSALRSMKEGELGTNIAVVRLSFVPTAIGAVLFLGEPFTLQKGMLLLFAVLAISLFFDHYRRENRLALSSLIPALTACMAFGVFDLVYKFASTKGVNPFTFLIVQSGTAHILINLYVVVREKYEFNRVVLRTAPVCGVLFASACLAWLKALKEVDVSLISPFIQMNFILSYLLAVVFFRESVTKRKLFGIAMVALCVILLSENLLQRLGDLWQGVVRG
jgi:drug/metabolite transporter (DMT)-like permease